MVGPSIAPEMRSAALFVATTVVTLVAAIYALRGALEARLEAPFDPDGEPRFVEVPEGITALQLVERFREAGLLPKSKLIELYAERLHAPRPLVPGEYRLSPGSTVVQLIERVERGRLYERTVTIPAGATLLDVARILSEEGIVDENAFVRAATDEALARRLGVGGPSVEGFLFPDVWAFPRGLPAEHLVERLVARFFEKNPSLDRAAERLGLTPYQFVVVASLVEFGPVLPAERRLYAALLIERLQKGYALEVEAADAYGRARPDAPEDPREDPWNTTERPGLPRTPIGSPSLAALRALADPVNTEPVFMVRREDGRNVFCPDVACYLRALEIHAPRQRAHFPKRFSRP